MAGPRLEGLGPRLARHKDLVLGLTRRELFSPFAGSAFGLAWALLHPLVQILVYLFVFSFVFRLKMAEGATAGLADYQAYLLAGLVPWYAWAHLLSTSCTSIVGSATLVRQADFPAFVLPVRTVLVALVPHAVGLVVLMLYVVLRHGTVPWTWSLLPLVVAIQTTAMLGVAYLLGALCVFVRDAKEVVTVFTVLGMWLIPAIYTPDVLEGMPAAFRWILAVNPFTHFVHVYRDCLYWSELRHPVSWAVCVLLGSAVLLAGQRVFERLRLFFGNFL